MPDKAPAQRAERIAGNMDTAFLKLLALVFMLVDHMGVVIFPGVTEMRVIGRMALPLYAWCLVVGSVKTRNPARYLLRLAVLAAVSQPLYMMALNHRWGDLNIIFLLLVAALAIQGIRARFMLSQIWAPALCYLLLGFIDADYGWRGLTFILLLYLARESRAGLAATYLAFALFWGASSQQVTQLFGQPLAFLSWPGLGYPLSALFRLQAMVWLSLPLILWPTHTGLRMPKWVGYGLYPLHLVALIVMRVALCGVEPSLLLSGF